MLADTTRETQTPLGRSLPRDAIDMGATILLAITIAVLLRTRAVPMHLSAVWVLAPVLSVQFVKSSRGRRVWFILWVACAAAASVSWAWIR